MQCLRNAESITVFLETCPHPELHKLISERMAELAEYSDYDISELVNFLVVDPGDSLASISQEVGFSVGDVSRPMESIAARGAWFEVVFVLGDDGFGLVIYVPAHGLNDPLLVELCARHAPMGCDP